MKSYLLLAIALSTLTLTACIEGEGSAGSASSEGEEYLAVDSSGEDEGANPKPQAGTLTAGDIDDNLNFSTYSQYLGKILQADTSQVFPAINLSSRITIQVKDNANNAVGHARILIKSSENELLYSSIADSKGVFYFFPYMDVNGGINEFTVEAQAPDNQFITIDAHVNLTELNEAQPLSLVLTDHVAELASALEVVFVIDTTGSMTDELRYITTEFESIVADIKQLHPSVAMQFGLVVYRDQGDAYVVQNFDFTTSVEVMKNQLSQQSSGGGGDYPEAMDQGLSSGLNLQWSQGNVARVLFLVADAPPHNDKLVATLELAQLARERGIGIYPLAASGSADLAENLMRLMAVITQGRYIFMTDDSGIGNSHAEPKVPCYIVTRLDQVINRIISEALTGVRLEPQENQIIRSSGQYDNGVCQ